MGRAAPTVARAFSAIAGIFDFAAGEGLVDRNPVARARRPKVSDVSPRRALSRAEIHALLAVPDPATLVGLRDRTRLVCLVTQGWRVSEALGLRVEALDEEAGHRVATITGKGGKIARVPLAAEAWSAIQSWMTSAQIKTGPIFVAVEKGGRVKPGSAMSQQAVWKRLLMLATKAGINRQVSAHVFRHSAVTHALAGGVPLHEVQDFARHADPRTTRRYDSHRQSLSNRTPHTLAATLLEPK